MRGFEHTDHRSRAGTQDRDVRAVRGGVYDMVREHLDDMFDVIIEGPPRPRSLRSSSLPYCPVLDLVVPREADQTDLRGALYTSMGTAAHLALQAFASLSRYGPNCWGKWKCPRCTHQWTEPQFRPDRCPGGCNDAPIYEELTFRYMTMSGHSDLVVRYPGGHWVVHEYKTCGRRPRQASRRHLLQARTYCTMLRRQYGITASYVIVYVQREDLKRWPFGPYDWRDGAQEMTDWTSRSVHGFRAVSATRRRASAENLHDVARCRPCVDRESHDEYMARRWEFSKKPCEFLPVCSTTDRAVTRMMRDLLDD